MAKKSTQQSAAPLFLMILGSVIILVVVMWQTSRVLSNLKPTVIPTTTAVSNIPYPGVPRISLTDAKAAFDAGKSTFIDVRGEPNYSAGHIPGALDIAYADIETKSVDLQKDQHLILYCT